MNDVHFSPDFKERTANAMMQTKKIRRPGLLYTAVAAVAAVAVTLGALSLPDLTPSGTLTPSSPLSAYALSLPTYPDFPQQPIYTEDMDWKEYSNQMDAYSDALRALRGEVPLSPALTAQLNSFASSSTPLALSGLKGENGVYSPLSLWSALAMLSRCTDADSRAQILSVLGADSVEQVDAQVEQVWKNMTTDDGLSALRFSNSVWLNQSLDGTYVQSTLDALARKHFAASYRVPMGTQEADLSITQWISEQTKGLIGSEAPVTQTSAHTLALLASSLYFKANWLDEFFPENNTEDTFTSSGGSRSKATFMHRTNNSTFLRADGYQASWLPTQLGVMTFVLPDEGVSPEQLLADPDFLSSLDSRADDVLYGQVRWSVPKFDADSSLALNDTLKALGITQALDPEQADFSALTSLPAVLSKVEQLARIKVDEEGVEAAAVTLAVVDCTSAAPTEPENICVMDLDRPFLFVLRYDDIPLFVGIVNQV